MRVDDLTSAAIAKALRLGLPFAAYALPSSERIVFMADSGVPEPTIGTLTFTIYPWLSTEGSSIRGTLSVSDVLAMPDDGAGYAHQPVSMIATAEDDYIRHLSLLLDRLKLRGGKTVYSRVACGQLESLDAAERVVFDGPLPNMRAIFFHPEVGCWLVSTPETLLSARDGVCYTMALAGTRLAGAGVEWDAKNKEEQAIVTREIVSTLRSLGIESAVGSPYTRQSGRIEHICTDIKGELGVNSPADVAMRLCPTPALGGYPRVDALRDIAELESHDRECYGGYIALSDGDNYDAYVTIRCARVDPSTLRYRQYAGGGITPMSNPATEWAETESKLLIR